ncbi:hypothetical protein Ancab_029614, partial [Ancistrocladus abbreviatus]
TARASRDAMDMGGGGISNANDDNVQEMVASEQLDPFMLGLNLNVNLVPSGTVGAPDSQ